MDDVDMTAERQERESLYLIRASRKPEGPKPLGFCLYCGEEFKDFLKRFCNEECRDSYESEARRKKDLGLN